MNRRPPRCKLSALFLVDKVHNASVDSTIRRSVHTTQVRGITNYLFELIVHQNTLSVDIFFHVLACIY